MSEQKLLNFARLYGAEIRISIQVGDVVKLKTGGPEMRTTSAPAFTSWRMNSTKWNCRANACH